MDLEALEDAEFYSTKPMMEHRDILQLDVAVENEASSTSLKQKGFIMASLIIENRKGQGKFRIKKRTVYHFALLFQ